MDLKVAMDYETAHSKKQVSGSRLFITAEKVLTKHSAGNEQIDGIGISCGGPLSTKRGLILSPPDLPGWDNIPIVQMAENRFDRHVLMQNDANACAVA